MATWHRVRDEAGLRDRAPLAVKIAATTSPSSITTGSSDLSPNLQPPAGPLSEGQVRGEFVMWPCHAWECSVVTGKGLAGYDEEQVPMHSLESRADGLYIDARSSDRLTA
jgi:hypothetical protein